MKLNELKVQSFQTTLQEDTAKTIRGGSNSFCYTTQGISLFRCMFGCRFCASDDTDG